MDEKRSYTVKELQEILQVSRPAVGRRRRKIPHIQKSFDRWFDGDDAD